MTAESSRLLIDESPLQVLPELAAKIGLNEAIVLQQLHYWTRHSTNRHRGHRWVYNTVGEWQAQFPFWSPATIKRIFASLRASGLVVVEQGVARRGDRTNWYRLAYEKMPKLASAQIEPTTGADRALPTDQSEPMCKETETSQERTTRTAARTRSEPVGFQEWLEHHSELTGQRIPGALTKARSELARKFSELMGEGRSLDELKLASAGAHADKWRAEHGKDYPRNVLVFETIDELIDKGRRAAGAKSEKPNRFVRTGPIREI